MAAAAAGHFCGPGMCSLVSATDGAKGRSATMRRDYESRTSRRVVGR